MREFDPEIRDPLDDFEKRKVTLLGKTKTVYVAGSGPAVIVMSEIPGITPYVARFARWVRDAGLTVYMPSLSVPALPVTSTKSSRVASLRSSQRVLP